MLLLPQNVLSMRGFNTGKKVERTYIPDYKLSVGFSHNTNLKPEYKFY